MRRLALRINIDGKTKKFKASKSISLETVQLSLDLEREMDEGITTLEIIDRLLTFICSVFGHQFNEEDLLKGLDHFNIIPLANKCYKYAISRMGIK